ncbi:MAG: DUF2723 domain-containing protein [Deltaproteobacteria bacterium]|nr:DUF2723 domain-containing protein [Deltaproteobacteria bacterium]
MTSPRCARAVPRIVGLLAFGGLVVAVAPGPYWLDSQELAASAVRLGVPHPTGFPLYMVIAHLASWIPWGELAFRIHLVSSACAAVAVAMTTRIVLELNGDNATSLVGAVAAGGLLFASGTFFRQASVAEVYTPTAAWIALSLWLVLRTMRGGGARAGLLLSLAFGIGAVGVHASYRIVVGPPLFVLFVLGARRRRWLRMAPLLAALGMLAMTLYLPVRSASGRVPALDWGHPSTVSALWSHLTAQRIREAFQGEIMSSVPEVFLENGRALGRVLEEDLGPIAISCSALGLIALLASRRGGGGRLLGGILAWMAIADFAYGAWVNPMGLEDRQNGVPMAVALSLLAGVGMSLAVRRLGRMAPHGTAALGFMALVPAWFVSHGEKLSTRASDAPRRWSEVALAQCPSRSVALVQGDSTAAGLLWLTLVEGARPDVAVLARQHLWDLRRDRDVLGAVGVRLGARPKNVLGVIFSSGRPVAWEPGADLPPGGRKLAWGVPLALVDGTESEPLTSIQVLKRIFGTERDPDPNARRQHAQALSALGRGVLMNGDRAQAQLLFAAGREVDPRHVSSYVNLGVLHAQAGDHVAAALVTEEALAVRPNHDGALVNAARYRLALGDDMAARRHALRAVKVAPHRADAWSLLGIIEARAGEVAEAQRHLENALRLDPSEPDARASLPRLRRGAVGGQN